jgi:hypothetical protein
VKALRSLCPAYVLTLENMKGNTAAAAAMETGHADIAAALGWRPAAARKPAPALRADDAFVEGFASPDSPLATSSSISRGNSARDHAMSLTFGESPLLGPRLRSVASPLLELPVTRRRGLSSPAGLPGASTPFVDHLTLINASEVTLGARIGKGAFGEVFKASWGPLIVAVKRTKVGTRDHLCVCICVCMHACKYVCMYACMCLSFSPLHVYRRT